MIKAKFILFFIAGSLSLHAQPNSSELKISGTGFSSSEGVALIQIFNRPEGFPKEQEKAYKVLKAPIVNGKCSLTIRLPKGEYAIVVIHDENNNGKVDTNWMGMPIESIGLSNYSTKSFPSFEKAVFALSKDTEIQINTNIF